MHHHHMSTQTAYTLTTHTSPTLYHHGQSFPIPFSYANPLEPSLTQPSNQAFTSINHHPNSYTNSFDPVMPSLKQVRLDFATFGGGDPIEWLNKAERLFEFYQIPEGKKVAMGVVHLSDTAADRWYMFSKEFRQDWQGLTKLLMREFSSSNITDHQAALGRMSQGGSMEEYMEKFTKLSRRTPGFSQQMLMSFFIAGLKSALRADVKAFKPKTLYEACELARIFGEKENNIKQSQKYNNLSKGPSTYSYAKAPNKNPNTSVTQVSNPKPAMPRISESLLLERKAKKQCYSYGEPFHRENKCEKWQGKFMSIEVMLDNEKETEAQEEQSEEEEKEEIEMKEVQLKVLGGLQDSKTMQIKGKVGGVVVHTLIDTGASHNFIHPEV